MAPALDGNHVLYHYLEKDLKEADIWLFQMLAARLFTALGIWFPTSVYASCPIVLPFAVRDPTCRPRKRGDPDEWGAPDLTGHFRDDNSLVKSLPRSLPINSPRNPLYHGRRLGNGFVACHVWRVKAGTGADLSSRDPDTYSFIPNLVWLPVQVAKLTDREGSFAQAFLQALAVKIYRCIEVPCELRPAVERAWSKLPLPTGIPESGLPHHDDLAYFGASETYTARRISVLRTVARGLDDVAEGRSISSKIVSSRYTTGLPSLSPSAFVELRRTLGQILGESGSEK
jgi:hypothetical protein